MRTQLTFTIGAGQDTTQEKIFAVSQGCNQIYFSYDLVLPFTMVTFVMVKDPSGNVRFLKQMGYSKHKCAIGHGAHDTTIGGVPGEIPAGNWTFRISIFAEYADMLKTPTDFHVNVSDEGKEDISEAEVVQGSIWTCGKFQYGQYDFKEMKTPEQRWYRGDLHTHTRLSDGKETPESASRKAENMGLDFYAPTEHNVLHTGWPNTEVLILPGVEITTCLGHANLFGVNRIPSTLENILGNRDKEELKEDILRTQDECKEEGWLFSVNHPFLYTWKWLMRDLPLSKVDCLEICNDPTYAAVDVAKAREANKKTVMLSDLLWEDGHRICAIGGSDSHNTVHEFYPGAEEPSIPGDPSTWLYMNGLSVNNSLNAMRCCYSYVTRHCKITSNLLFGSQLTNSEQEIMYVLQLSGQAKKPDIFYYYNGEKIPCDVNWIREETWEIRGSISLKQEEYQWIRFGAEDAEGNFLFYANPITKGRKDCVLNTYGEAIDELENRMPGH